MSPKDIDRAERIMEQAASGTLTHATLYGIIVTIRSETVEQTRRTIGERITLDATLAELRGDASAAHALRYAVQRTCRTTLQALPTPAELADA